MNETKVFFAHSKKDYDTEYSLMGIISIMNEYNMNVCFNGINPSILKISKKYQKKIDATDISYVKFMLEMEFYFEYIKQCDVLVALPYSKTGKFTNGVKKAIEFAQRNNIKAYKLTIGQDHDDFYEILDNYSKSESVL